MCILQTGKAGYGCAHSNCHIIKDGKLITAPTDNLILPGIVRAHLIKACKKLEIPVSETPYTLDEMFDADEVLVTSFKQALHVCEMNWTGSRLEERHRNFLRKSAKKSWMNL